MERTARLQVALVQDIRRVQACSSTEDVDHKDLGFGCDGRIVWASRLLASKGVVGLDRLSRAHLVRCVYGAPRWILAREAELREALMPVWHLVVWDGLVPALRERHHRWDRSVVNVARPAKLMDLKDAEHYHQEE